MILPIKLLFFASFFTLGCSVTKKIPEDFKCDNSSNYVSFVDQELEQIPIEIKDCEYITMLNVSSNQINELPDFLFEMENIKELNIGRNNLKSLDSRVSQLINLEALYIHENSIKSIPSLDQLKHLKLVVAYGNRIPELHQEELKKKYPNVGFKFYMIY